MCLHLQTEGKQTKETAIEIDAGTETGRQAWRQTERQAERPTGRQTGTETGRQRQRDTEKQIVTGPDGAVVYRGRDPQIGRAHV